MIPGLPDRRNYGNLANLKPLQVYTLLRQFHNASRAGKHIDVRIGSPTLGMFSWAAPKDLPKKNEKRLLITQPLHTYAYKDFLGLIYSPYGRGTVKKLLLSPVIILLNTPDKIKFTRANQNNGPIYTMIKTKNNNWITTMKYPDGSISIKHMKKKSNLQKIALLNLQLLINLARPYYTDEKWLHIKLVLKQALDIKLKPLSNVLKAIIYMHDTLKKRMGNKGHLKAGAILARKLLRGKYDKATLKRIYNAIQLHSPDYRLSIKNFQHSSPLALLLAIADDSNNIRRDPLLTSMYTIKYTKGEFKDKDSPLRSFIRHKQFFGPLLGHPNLKYYKDRWKEYAKLGIKNILNYPFLKYKVLYSLVNKDTLLPDIDLLTKKL